MISIRSTTYRGKDGFAIVGTLPGSNRRVNIFTTNRKSAEHIRDLVKAGKDIDVKAFQKYEANARLTEDRDYKKEYAKFQSSPKRKKYRAELNKYNRNKGTYGNGDGKDASHKGGKIFGYETESKNRGRREKSRKKGSTRKTENVMSTLREFIVRETNVALDERVSRRWNIVEDGGQDVQSIVNQKAIERAVKKGDAAFIQKVIGKAAALRQKLNSRAHISGTRRQIRKLDDVIRNLVRILVHVKQGTNEAWGKPEPPASAIQSKEIDPNPVLSGVA